MFQMMNEARLMIGAHAVATASVAYHEAVAYARERKQGRRLTERDPTTPPVAIIEHDDVKRMLLRMRAIVSGGLALVAHCAWLADRLDAGAEGTGEAQLILDLLTPIAKSFPAEQGYEVNVLAVQGLGGYGYSSEYQPEAWLRDQKLNSIHEGTTGIQSLDLLGRKVVAEQGRALAVLAAAITADVEAATGEVGRALGLELAEAARRVGEVTRRAARYWYATELSRTSALVELLASGEDSFASMEPGWF